MSAPVVDITIVKGKTFEFSYRYADDELVYKPITAMPSTAPVRLTVTAHGIPDGWPVQIQSLKNPQELNSNFTGCTKYYFATVVDADTIELNSVNASGWKPYVSGGYVVFNKPADLTGYEARMEVRDKVGGEVLLTFDSDPLATPDGTITIDVALSAFVVRLPPAASAALTFKSGVYDLEAVTPGGDVYPITAISGVAVIDEVTA